MENSIKQKLEEVENSIFQLQQQLEKLRQTKSDNKTLDDTYFNNNLKKLIQMQSQTISMMHTYYLNSVASKENTADVAVSNKSALDLHSHQQSSQKAKFAPFQLTSNENRTLNKNNPSTQDSPVIGKGRIRVRHQSELMKSPKSQHRVITHRRQSQSPYVVQWQQNRKMQSPQQIQSQSTQLSKETAISFDEYNRKKQQKQNQPQASTAIPGLVSVQQQTHKPQTHQPQSQMAHRVHEIETRDHKMLVILDSGEQRLITFTLPRKTCTVQELLEQVNIRVDKDSDIECIANPGGGIDYVVKVGQNKTDHAALIKAAENAISQRQNQQNQLQQQQRIIQQKQQLQKQQPFPAALSTFGSSSTSKLSNFTKPKYILGFLAVCAACGATGFDHAKCERCQRVFTEEPKSIRIDSGDTTQKLVKTKVIEKKATQKKHQVNLAGQRFMQQKRQSQKVPRQPFQTVPSTTTGSTSSAKNTTKVPDTKKSKYILGFLAVCSACGATGFDHAKCERCQRVFTEEPKSIRIVRDS